MSQSKRQFFSGNSIEQAVLAAACHYHVDPDRIAYHQVEKRHGFVKLRRRVVIEVDPDNLLRPEREVKPAAAAPEPRRERPLPPERPPAEVPPEHPSAAMAERLREPAAAAPPQRREERRQEREEEPPRRRDVPAGQEELVAGGREAAELILRLAKLDLQAQVSPGDDRLEVDLDGPDRDRLLDEEGEVLQAIEYLVPRVMRGIVGDSTACRVDSGSFRRNREEELVALAKRTAEAVREKGGPITLEPMNPTERRIVHITLSDEPDVTTESEGEGYFKQVVVFPE